MTQNPAIKKSKYVDDIVKKAFGEIPISVVQRVSKDEVIRILYRGVYVALEKERQALKEKDSEKRAKYFFNEGRYKERMGRKGDKP